MIPFVCLPGLMCTGQVYDALESEIAEPLTRIELPDGSDFNALAESIAAQLLDDSIVCGMSMGAYLAIAVAHKMPERVRGLILVGGSAAADSVQAAEMRGKTVAWANRKGIDALSAGQADALLARANRANPALRAKLTTMAQDVGLEVFANHQTALAGRPDLSDALAKLDCPVLSITGGEDAVNPPEVGRKIAETARTGEFQLIETAGHLPILETPQIVADMMGKFRQRILQESSSQ